MNIETKKMWRRYLLFFAYWTAVVCLGFLLFPAGGSGSGGTGTGAGTHGTGSGKGGSGSSVLGTSDQGTGTNEKATVAAPAGTAPAATAPVNAKQGRAQIKKPTPKPSQQAALKVFNKDEASDEVATIFIDAPNSGSGSGEGTTAGFFGMEISGPVIFLLDVSGSMASHNADGNKSRLQLVKEEMKKTLNSKFAESKKKRNKDHFRIVTFSSGNSFFPEISLPGHYFKSASAIASAITFVQSLTPGGGTDMKTAWLAIIPIIRREEIRSVYFLSDGEPGDCTPPELLHILKSSVPKLKIHTISMGASSQLLKDIASQHKGQYREVH